jgi:hypothetical protein
MHHGTNRIDAGRGDVATELKGQTLHVRGSLIQLVNYCIQMPNVLLGLLVFSIES